MLGALIAAFILCCVIRGFTGEEVGFVKAFLVALLASIVSSCAVAVAAAPIESIGLSIAVILAIHFGVTAVAVQLLCSTDVKTVLKIALTYLGIQLAWQLTLIFCLAGLIAATS